MTSKFLPVILTLLVYLLCACGSAASGSNPIPVDKQAVINLVCGPENQPDCVSTVCEDEDACPLFSALSSQAVFDFVQTYSQCEDCNTPDFQPQLGIGKCIEYRVSEISNGWTVTFSVSESCSFRYGSPKESTIRVNVNSEGLQIGRTQPPIEYIKDPSYCQTDDDCYCLSGSGVAFVGCSNLLYAPLNGSGYYIGEVCGCVSNQCAEK